MKPGSPLDLDTKSPYDNLRELADRDRRETRPDPEIMDGRYGFDEPSANRNGSSRSGRQNRGQNAGSGRGARRGGGRSKVEETGLYSDKMMVDQRADLFPPARRDRR